MADRHQFRAKWHGYNGGIYFITVCSHEKLHTFGRIIDESTRTVGTRFIASALGEIVEEHIKNIPKHYRNVEILNQVVMPNHIHFVINIEVAYTTQSSDKVPVNTGCLKGPKHGEGCPDRHHNSKLATIIGAFKAGVTRTARTRRIASLPVWQSRYHEHIIRNQRAFDNIMTYIDSNVENWSKDCFAE